MNLYLFLLKNYDKKKKLIYNDKEYTYLYFINLIEHASKYLCKLNKLKKILIITDNPFYISVLYFVAARCGYTLITLNKSLSKKQVLEQVNYSKPDCIIFSKKLLKINKNTSKSIVLDEEKIFNKSEIKIDNFYNIKKNLDIKYKNNFLKKDYIVTFSSGTTFKPKPILFTQEIKLKRYYHIKNLYNVTKKDNTLSFSPLDHSLGQRLFFLATLSGSNFLYFDNYNFLNLRKKIKKYNITFTILPSNYLHMLKDHLITKKINIKKIVSAASSLDSRDKEILKENNIRFYEMYGASEIGTVSSLSFKSSKKYINSVGKVLKNIKIKILSEKKKFVKEKIPGQILCKTPLKFKEYFNNKFLTKSNYFKGYFMTGDIGYLKRDHLYFLSRKKDVIISSGINIYPSDIERELNRHPNIKESAVIGLKDIFFGEVVFAVCIVHKKKNDMQLNLNNYLLKKISTKQIPLGYSFVKKLPKSIFGKVLKKQLKNEYDEKKLDLSKKIRLILN